jgi:hypothetical protein
MQRVKIIAFLLSVACAGVDAQVNSVSKDSKLDSSKIHITVGRQNLDGFNASSMNSDFLKWFEQYSKKRVEQISAEYMASIGKSKEKLTLKSEATYLEKDQKKLAVIRFYQPGMEIFFLMVGGVVGDEFVRVGCFRYSSVKIPMTYGECGSKISEVYAIGL